MPKRYEAIRDALLKKGYDLSAAKTYASKIFNGTRPAGVKPVTGKNYDAKKST